MKQFLAKLCGFILFLFLTIISFNQKAIFPLTVSAIILGMNITGLLTDKLLKPPPTYYKFMDKFKLKKPE